ncbi:GTP pyrophosphokinase [Weissella hellenica]|uniref:GTP pyrophosphokinase n=1 Tax=Weissella hellenica TaxID=46256 RepID=A0A4Y4FZ87_WEIHE|nr:GTP pyrophosphokinase [Weissella hellenica]NKY66392.1 GTP pyrophosphokinase family protein [Weissella hellenica]GED35482.1 GTP pyrophosphokinase [Weissella hellenica]SCB72617.1 putative GTP pyrophosphokinase [Weissella hellenica]
MNSKRNTMSVRKIRQLLGDDSEYDWIANQLTQIAQMYQVYESAQREISTKLENLDAEFEVNYNHNPIHHIDGRMKDPQSLVGKIKKKNLAPNVAAVKNNIFDIAGLRVITNYIDDICTVEKLLSQQDDVEVIKRKDYIKNPKASGYRSLHLVVKVPVFKALEVESIPVEIQIRTIGMDMWASLEHELRYKTDVDRAEEFADNLVHNANALFDIEQNFQDIHHEL